MKKVENSVLEGKVTESDLAIIKSGLVGPYWICRLVGEKTTKRENPNRMPELTAAQKESFLERTITSLNKKGIYPDVYISEEERNYSPNFERSSYIDRRQMLALNVNSLYYKLKFYKKITKYNSIA